MQIEPKVVKFCPVVDVFHVVPVEPKSGFKLAGVSNSSERLGHLGARENANTRSFGDLNMGLAGGRPYIGNLLRSLTVQSVPEAAGNLRQGFGSTPAPCAAAPETAQPSAAIPKLASTQAFDDLIHSLKPTRFLGVVTSHASKATAWQATEAMKCWAKKPNLERLAKLGPRFLNDVAGAFCHKLNKPEGFKLQRQSLDVVDTLIQRAAELAPAGTTLPELVSGSPSGVQAGMKDFFDAISEFGLLSDKSATLIAK